MQTDLRTVDVMDKNTLPELIEKAKNECYHEMFYEIDELKIKCTDNGLILFTIEEFEQEKMEVVKKEREKRKRADKRKRMKDKKSNMDAAEVSNSNESAENIKITKEMTKEKSKKADRSLKPGITKDHSLKKPKQHDSN